PPQYNGYKVYWEDGAQMPPERADEVLSFIRGRTYTECLPMEETRALSEGLLLYVGPDVDDAYIESVKTLCVRPDLLREYGHTLKIVYTPLHGSGNVPVRRVLGEVGISGLLTVPEQENPDGNFPTIKVPNPEEPDTFRMAIALADREGADACFATDPDCDRLGVATRGPDGRFILLTGNQIGCLLLHYILSSKAEAGTLPKNAAIVKSVVSTELARAIAEHYGAAMIDTLTGFKFIAEQIQRFEESGEHTFVFGFEESYGYLSSTFVRDKDAVNASLLVTELALFLKQQGKTLWDRLEEIRAQFGYAVERVESVTLPGKDGAARMGEIMRVLRDNPPETLAGIGVMAVRDFQTGLRTDKAGQKPMGLPLSDVLYFELEGKHWVCVRPSGTEPKIKLYVNTIAASQREAEALAGQINGAARALLV
ncbi:MAG: phospho-sugar mutase, partial [Firmicutes bacterium]|nr:phospho-sugar mutase [Bacillota bacterium]